MSESTSKGGIGRLAGKVALITGGARGQGAAEATRFVAEGAAVVISDVLDADGELMAKTIGDMCTYVHHDVTSEDDWIAVVAGVVEQHGRLDILINNAGIFPIGGVLDTTLAAYEHVIKVNQTGVFLGMQVAAKAMIAAGPQGCSIVNISSIAGLQGAPGFIGYGASKWAVRGMTKSAARELAPHGIRVNSVHPGIIETPMLETFDAIGGTLRETIRERIPLGRNASADEVANLVLYLASDESSYSSGSEFVVDGAWMS